MKKISTKKAKERNLKIQQCIKDFDLEKDYVYRYGVPCPVLRWNGFIVAELGKYEGNHAGFACLSFYDYTDYTERRFREILTAIPERISFWQDHLEEKESNYVKQKEKVLKNMQYCSNVKQKSNDFKGEKYNNTLGIMIKNGRVVYFRKDRNFDKAEKIEEWKWSSCSFCSEVEKLITCQ